jgi:hypothetical protein
VLRLPARASTIASATLPLDGSVMVMGVLML